MKRYIMIILMDALRNSRPSKIDSTEEAQIQWGKDVQAIADHFSLHIGGEFDEDSFVKIITYDRGK